MLHANMSDAARQAQEEAELKVCIERGGNKGIKDGKSRKCST